MSDHENFYQGFPPDFSRADIEIIHAVQPYTITSPERVFALIQAVRYIIHNHISGDIVECGVWKGGSMMAAAKTLLQLNSADRYLYLFDTFEGMTPPGERDVSYEGYAASEIFEQVKCYAPQDEVEIAVRSVGYDNSKIRFVKGRVEDTLPDQAPSVISLLRLDTDWYESTRHELIHLFPRLSKGGVIIIDDYGHWRGARHATDEYLSHSNASLLLNRIDYTGRIGVKI
jgi:O-methyltransferase